MVQVAVNGATNGRKLHSNGVVDRNHALVKDPPASAFYWTMASVAACVILLQLGFLGLEEVLRSPAGIAAMLGFPPASLKTCQSQPDNEKCGRPDLFAFQMISLFVFLLVGGWGFHLWHASKSDSVHRFNSPSTRLYGYQHQAEWLTIVNLAYQIWDFAISLTIPEHCTAIMLAHHVVAATVSFSAVYNHMLGYYSVFFLGLSEISSIFLVSIDAAKYFEPMPDTYFETYTLHFAKPLFMIIFIYYRVVLWWPVSKRLLDDVRAVTSSGQAEDLRPGRTWILYMWVILNFPMGLLQLYWAALILGKAYVSLSGQ